MTVSWLLLGVSGALAQDIPVPPPAPVAPVAPKAPVADAAPIVRPPVAPPPAPGEVQVSMDFAPDASLYDMALFFGQLRQLNLVIANAEELRNQRVDIVANRPVTVAVAWATFLDALAVAGYRVDQTDQSAHIVKQSTGLPSLAPTLRTGAR